MADLELQTTRSAPSALPPIAEPLPGATLSASARRLTRSRRLHSSALEYLDKLNGSAVIDRENYADLDLDTKVEQIQSLVPLGLMHIEELLDEKVTALASERLDPNA